LSAGAFSRVDVEGITLRCGAGARLKTIANEARDAGLAGFEFLEGIPGGLGGALRMNAGAMGGAVFDLARTVRFMDDSGVVFERDAASLNPTYRSCSFFKTNFALGAVLEGRADQGAAIAVRMKEFSLKRWEHQPKEPSAGCTFKNPAASPAGRLIDNLGLKGLRSGGAVVSPVHGNFIVNDGSATARDVLNLIDQIRQRVKASEGIDLETEVEIIGED
jgi:UDP-N-acetylenolpyruvoylglucosamine reductase